MYKDYHPPGFVVSLPFVTNKHFTAVLHIFDTCTDSNLFNVTTKFDSSRNMTIYGMVKASYNIKHITIITGIKIMKFTMSILSSGLETRRFCGIKHSKRNS